MRTLRRVLAGVALLAAQAGAAQPADGGRAIYLEGRLASGEPVRASVQKGVPLEGAAAACVNCHRRSGLGGSEGQNAIRPIAGRLLFSSAQSELARRWAVPPGSGAARPAYDRASLARALREGVDPDGRPLDPLMPRYALGDDDIGRLQAYLQGLSATAAPGVTDHEIHFATILTPGVDPDRRRAQLDVLQAFVRDKNGDTRKETRRREAGAEQMYLAYRRWVLHVWTLEGAPETWRAQLDARYRGQPVFAVLGGLGRGSWQPVHAFCEGNAIPCVFPDVDQPVAGDAGYYTLYYSRGLALEADVLASQLADGPTGRIVQVFRDDAVGSLAAHALRAALQRHGIDALVDRPLGGGPLSAAAWARLLGDQQPAVVVAWLEPADWRGLLEAGAPPAALQALYLSASLAGGVAGLPARWRSHVRVVHPFEQPADQPLHLARVNAWLRARQIPPGDPRTQANAYFAATIAADAVTHIGQNLSRDYFIERIEQMAETSPAPSIYPRLSLGPGQRFASRGGYILGFAPGEEHPVPLGGWRVP
jgi:ABC-type branched-subunit amino acid transport system substrate-binding protein